MALPGNFEFAVKYTKVDEKVFILDLNPWLAKMCTCPYTKHFETRSEVVVLSLKRVFD